MLSTLEVEPDFRSSFNLKGLDLGGQTTASATFGDGANMHQWSERFCGCYKIKDEPKTQVWFTELQAYTHFEALCRTAHIHF